MPINYGDNNISTSGIITATSGNFTNSLQVNGTGVSLITHTHGNISSSGTIGSTSGLLVTTTTNGALTTSSSISSLNVTGSGSFASGINTTNLDITARYTEKVVSTSIISSGLTLNLNSGNLFTSSLNSNISSISITGVPVTSEVAVGFSLIFTADGTARTVTWPSDIKWAGNTAPTLTSASGKRDFLTFISTNNGTDYLGFVGGQNY